MPIIFISLNESFTNKIKLLGFESKMLKIQDYIPNPVKKTYYVSPANSLCFMDGGMDYALSRIVFPNIEVKLKSIVKQLGIQNYTKYKPNVINKNIIINEPNLSEQPKYYQNTEFFEINPEKIINC